MKDFKELRNNKKIKTNYLSFNQTLVNQELLVQNKITIILRLITNYIQICKYLIIILLKIMSKLYEKN